MCTQKSQDPDSRLTVVQQMAKSTLMICVFYQCKKCVGDAHEGFGTLLSFDPLDRNFGAAFIIVLLLSRICHIVKLTSENPKRNNN
jgi:hypothetical protein